MKKPYQDVRGEQYLYLLMAINIVKKKEHTFSNGCRIAVVGNINDNMQNRQFIIRNAKDGNALLKEIRKSASGYPDERYYLIINYNSKYPTINTIKFGYGHIKNYSLFGYHDEDLDRIYELANIDINN